MKKSNIILIGTVAVFIALVLGYVAFVKPKSGEPVQKPKANNGNNMVSKIYYVKSSGNIYKLYKANLDGTNEDEISDITETNHAQISPDKKEIAYIDNENIMIINTDGQNKRKITPIQNVPNNEIRLSNFIWTEDGQYFIFESFMNENPELTSDDMVFSSIEQIGKIKKDGTGKTIFYSKKIVLDKNKEDLRTLLGYSTNKKELYLLVKPDANENVEFGEMEIINIENNTKKKLNFGQKGWWIGNVHLSNDSSKIFFLGVDLNKNIYNIVVYDLLNKEQQIITSYKDGIIYDFIPSPDGQKILYRVGSSGNVGCKDPDTIQIYLVDTKTNESLKIIDELGLRSGPISWSPEQGMVLFYHEGYANECMSSGGKGDLDRYYIANPQGIKINDLLIKDYQEQYSGQYIQMIGWGN